MPVANTSLHILIVGAGIAGFSAAIACRRYSSPLHPKVIEELTFVVLDTESTSTSDPRSIMSSELRSMSVPTHLEDFSPGDLIR